MFDGTIASVMPTVSALFGMEPPGLSSEPPLSSVMADAHAQLHSTVSRCLVYCPDALGDHVWNAYSRQ